MGNIFFNCNGSFVILQLHIILPVAEVNSNIGKTLLKLIKHPNWAVLLLMLVFAKL